MNPRTPNWLVLMMTAALLTGCGESGTDADQTAEPDAAPATTPSDRAAIADQDDEPGPTLPVDDNDGVFANEIPEVNAATLKALRRQAAVQDKVLVIDCWATWCSSCVAMFPHLHQAMKERGDDVILISLTFDEGEALIEKAPQFLTEQNAWNNAYRAAEGSDAKDAIAKALSANWDGGVLPAVFVYKPDGAMAYEMLETRGEVQDWVDEIAQAVDQALHDAERTPGQ